LARRGCDQARIRRLLYRSLATPDEVFLETTAHERASSFSTQKIWKRAAIVAAGPIANFMLAIAIYTGTFYVHGRSILVPVVDSITKDSAAEAAGFQPGDRIVSVGGKKIDSFEDIQRIVDAAAGTQLQFIVDRSGQFVELAATPRRRNIATSFGSARVAVIGVESKAKPENSRIQTYDLAKSVELAVSETCYVVARTGRYIRGLVSGEESAGQLSGPIRIAEIAGEMAKIGVAALLNLAAVLSISVGMLNLLPIPVLDGGHLAYYAVEAIRGRAMNEKAQQFGINVGIVLIMSLMCFAAYNDILHLAQRSLQWE
jgi:regulator of sigma E protease